MNNPFRQHSCLHLKGLSNFQGPALRYRPDSMHISFEAAQTYCESRRVQGTVFNIFQLPSLVFQSDSGHLILSEINSKTYFNRLKLKKLKEIYDVLPVGTLSLNRIRFAACFALKALSGKKVIHLRILLSLLSTP